MLAVAGAGEEPFVMRRACHRTLTKRIMNYDKNYDKGTTQPSFTTTFIMNKFIKSDWVVDVLHYITGWPF